MSDVAGFPAVGWGSLDEPVSKTLPSRAEGLRAVILEPACLRLISGSTTYSCETSGKSLNLSVPWFSHMENGSDNGTYLIGLL